MLKFKLTNDTGTFNTFNEGSLCKEEDNEQGYDNKQTTSIGDDRFPKSTCSEVDAKALGNFNNIGKKVNIACCKEGRCCVERICPLP